jgi:putative aminopeptidase FrvX
VVLQSHNHGTRLVGLRYIHTVTEMAHKRDVKAGLDLLEAWLPGVK